MDYSRFVTVASPVNRHQGGAKNLGLQKAHGQWRFIKRNMYKGDFLKILLTQAPDFQNNVYYRRYTDEESRKLIALHMKSPVLFLIYYKLPHGYRRLRYGRESGNCGKETGDE